MQKFVNVETVNLRSVASTDANAPIGALMLGQSVDDLGDGPPGWHHVRVQQGRKKLEGFSVEGLADSRFKWTTAKRPTLRDPAAPAREALVAAAVEQWLRFDKGSGQEDVEPYSGFIGKMWQAFGENYTGKTNVPWSAVAISLMVRNAAQNFSGYAEFKESAGHSRYIWDAIKKAASGDTSAPFWGVRLPMARPQVGDIIGNWRNVPFTFDQYLNAATDPETPSHADIVVAVGPEVALAIGGNVKNSVYATGYQLTADGFLTPNRRIQVDGTVVGEAIVLMANRVG